ncbi:hypothetical protein [Pseudomonas japonica]|uniref:hypothetical protein n=1 Tax=Pseudomonas japonica TaxID=256466 RepID=UPI0015E2D3E7|nr:hypothetical protein [Pseudomonas japonica]MBA1241217.1 hypothetical protein [Pseudomonas japonica]
MRYKWWALPVVMAAGAGWLVYRVWQAPLPATPPLPSVAAKPISAPATLSPQVIARLFGLPSGAPLAQARTALKLKACVVAGEHSRILVEHAGLVQAYRIGDRLPDGSQVRRVNAGHAVLWQRGEEVVLALRQATANRPSFEAVDGPPATGTRRYLRSALSAGPHS